MAEFSVKAGAEGFEATAKAVESATNLALAEAKSNSSTPQDLENAQATGSQLAAAVTQATRPALSKKLADSWVLWVDDHPENNAYEMRSLSSFGVHFDTSLSTAQALQRLQQRKYDVLISDLGRVSDPQAGFTLLGELQKLGNKTPLIIYSSSATPALVAEATKRGAFGLTNSPRELFQLVLSAIETN
jgi:CheY-like chemotaxis protein